MRSTHKPFPLSALAGPTPHAGEHAGVWRKSLPWVLLVLLLIVLQAALISLVVSYEANRLQAGAETAAREAAAQVGQQLNRVAAALQSLPANNADADATDTVAWREAARSALSASGALLRIERRDADFALTDVANSAQSPALFTGLPREAQLGAAQAACSAAGIGKVPSFSRSYFTTVPQGTGKEVVDLCIATPGGGPVVGTLGLALLLEYALSAAGDTVHEFSFVEADGARLARAGAVRGRGLFRAVQPVDVFGSSLLLQANSSEGRPALLPSLSLALAAGLSLALLATLALLARDVRRRSAAERELAQALAFRRAMEDSLVTGLRARNLEGQITYVNPAFCKMVGCEPGELLGQTEPPYWPPELAPVYRERQAQRFQAGPEVVSRSGYETVFQRKNGERFPVSIYEAPLMERNATGALRHTGWMSAVLDLSEQRRADERARQQQDRLQATARLATMGEMASLLSHELNQPLAAIASYAQGSLNLMDEAAVDRPALQEAMRHIAEQAARAGRTIKSVQDFVRRREQAREVCAADVLVQAILPLAQLQTRKSGARIELSVPSPAPRVKADRTMIEQVLLNLIRNGLQAMDDEATPAAERVLEVTVSPADAAAGGRVTFSVSDRGPGIAPEVAERLFTPFFSTRADGMGLGLSLCRTVIEQHGGDLRWQPREAGAGGSRGTTFTFTLPAAP